MSAYSQIIKDGLWHNNVVFAQLLALCPLLAVTTTATNGLGMGLATTAVLTASNLLVSMSRSLLRAEVRIPIFVLLIATLVTLVDMLMNAWLHDLHRILGLFIPLIVTNCVILGRAEAFASRQPLLPSLLDGLMMGIGFTLALVLLGAAREILGSGTLFANASLLLGPGLTGLEMTLFDDYQGIVLLLLPPGGFIALGFLLVVKRLLDRSIEQGRQQRQRAAALDQSEPALQPGESQ
tara:strand:- start:5406 stop:6116 length:711 start_codon:yes stop_codon:yes gene_type:complete